MILLAENLRTLLSASIAFVRTNEKRAKPKPIYVNPQSSYFALGNPYTNRKSKSKRRKSFYSCSCFFLWSICQLCPRTPKLILRFEDPYVDSICSRYAANPQSSFFASGNPSRSNSIYCRCAPIRYEINPSFAQQTYRVRQHISNAIGVYRKSREGFISMRVLH